MPESEYRLLPYDPNIIAPDKADLKLEGRSGNWNKIDGESEFAAVEHLIVERDGKALFDKARLITSPGAFVLPVRITPEKHAEFLLINEWKYLLERRIPNIPQGRVKPGELPFEAAKREAKEETGYDPVGLVYIGEQVFDSAHMKEFQPYFLAIIPYEQEAEIQEVEDDEDIQVLPWMRMEEIRRLGISDGKTTIGLHLAEQVIAQHLL